MIKQEHTNLVSIKRACELCKVSRSGYYEWLRRPAKRIIDVLDQKIKRIFKKSRKTVVGKLDFGLPTLAKSYFNFRYDDLLSCFYIVEEISTWRYNLKSVQLFTFTNISV